MVVGVLTTSYPRDAGDFAGVFVADGVRSLARAGHDVEVLAGGGPGHDVERVGSRTVTVTRLPSRFGRGPDLFGGAGAPEALEQGGAAAVLAAARFSVELASAVAARAPRWHRIESHWLVPSALAAVAAAPRLPHRAHAHSGDVALLERMPFGRTIARRLSASGAELAFVSEALRARFSRLAGRDVGTVERLPVPAELFPARRTGGGPLRAAALGLRGPVVISVGRLVPIKGYDLLIRACAAQPVNRVNVVNVVNVVILGDGPERDRLASLAARLDVRLHLAGRVPRDRVAEWLSAADLYVQPSRALENGRTEGLPLSVLEARAVGLPVVASDSGGLAELAVGAADVSVFRAGDVWGLRAAIGRHLRDTVVTSA